MFCLVLTTQVVTFSELFKNTLVKFDHFALAKLIVSILDLFISPAIEIFFIQSVDAGYDKL